MKSYLFDVKLLATIRVSANSEDHARRILTEVLDCASANFGEAPDGSPIVAEASVDSVLNLVEVNAIEANGALVPAETSEVPA